ncbi:hypothetical protein PILCRDRAFT_636995 [Piloderma croceum F 1598]|uniref:Uncharacterized protein n=1 Tax=Piloderma croceum (strain F 1598) TaxID=765440 RepID=A0A0C3EW89_PILCF|nr:hypothetical protein PILCRDRAFT_636995 [Piloderma croceum F 1598]
MSRWVFGNYLSGGFRLFNAEECSTLVAFTSFEKIDSQDHISYKPSLIWPLSLRSHNDQTFCRNAMVLLVISWNPLEIFSLALWANTKQELSNTSAPNIDNALGALFLGNIAAAILYGVTCVQMSIYFQNYSDDKLMLKVVFLWMCDTVHLALITHSTYFYAVKTFTNPAALQHPTPTISTHHHNLYQQPYDSICVRSSAVEIEW